MSAQDLAERLVSKHKKLTKLKNKINNNNNNNNSQIYIYEFALKSSAQQGLHS